MTRRTKYCLCNQPQRLIDIFSKPYYPKMTHLCLPGDIFNGNGETSKAKRYISQMSAVRPREPPRDIPLYWDTIGDAFPALTHLYLPRLLIPDCKGIFLPPGQLVKISISAERPTSVESLCHMIQGQTSLQCLHIGPIMARRPDCASVGAWEYLEEQVQTLQLRDFRWHCPPMQATTGDLGYNAQSILGDQYLISSLDLTRLEVCLYSLSGIEACHSDQRPEIVDQ